MPTAEEVAPPTETVAEASPQAAAAPLAPVPVPGAYAAPWAPGAVQVVGAPAPRAAGINWARLLPSGIVAVIIAAVVLGGLGLDTVIAAPSAGIVTVGGSVTITAAPGWVLVSTPGDTSSGIELQKANAVLVAQVVSTGYSGDSASILPQQEQALSGESAQISFGDAHQGSIGGHDTTYVAFEEAVASGGRTGILDGELVCMVIGENAVVIVVGAPQGGLDPIVDDVSAMLKSLGAGL
jgi:hypothetical protein